MRLRRRGMTLVEIAVALGVLGIISVLTWQSVAGALDARDLLEQEDGVQEGARAVLARIERELRLAWLTSHREAAATYRTVFVGEDSDPVDRLWFATLAHRRLYRDARESDQAEITIWGDDDPDQPGSWLLLHRESPFVDQEPDRGGAVYPLAHGVKRLDFTYLDGNTNEWESSWDSTGVDQANRLPRAVRVLLVLLGPDPDHEGELKDYPFATTILLDYASPLERSAFARGGS